MNSVISMKGDLAVRKIKAKRPSIWWYITNFFPHIWSGLWRETVSKALGLATFMGTLRLMVLHADGTVTDYGVVSKRVVTTAFVTAVATNMYDGTAPALTAYDYHDAGTGAVAENVSNTGLGTPWGGARVSGTAANPSAGVYRSTATISFNNTFAITEHGLFSAAAAGTLCDRSVFAAVNVVNGESIQFVYDLTFSAGG